LVLQEVFIVTAPQRQTPDNRSDFCQTVLAVRRSIREAEFGATATHVGLWWSRAMTS
jgi:hypothetical protein